MPDPIPPTQPPPPIRPRRLARLPLKRMIGTPLLIATLVLVVAIDASIERWSVDHAAWLPPGVMIFVLMAIGLTLASIELVALLEAQGIAGRRWLGAAATLAALAAAWIMPRDTTAAAAAATGLTIAFAVLVASLVTFSRGRRVEGVMASTAGALLGLIYLGGMPAFLLLLRKEHSAWWIAGVLLTVKVSDMAAYLTGHAIGRHKLIPWLSPGKTWEGLLGGAAGAMIVGAGLALVSAWLARTGDQITPLAGAVAGLLLTVIGLFGDLTVSLVKRAAGAKDSSRSLPGFGGVLDVLDSLILACPVAWWLAHLSESLG